MYSERLAFEQYRIRVMKLWPDGPRKEAGLASARYAIETFVRTTPNGPSLTCVTGAGRRYSVTLIPRFLRVDKGPFRLAA